MENVKFNRGGANVCSCLSPSERKNILVACEESQVVCIELRKEDTMRFLVTLLIVLATTQSGI